MFDEASGATSQFDKGQMVFDDKSGQSGIIVSGEYAEFSGRFVYRIHVPGMACLQSWGEARLTAAPTLNAIAIGDMVIAFDNVGTRNMGQVTGKTVDGFLKVRMADGLFKVNLNRVWRVWPMALGLTVAA